MTKNPNNDLRKHSRESQSKTVTFSIVGSFSGRKEFMPESDMKCTIVDLSANGLGILSDLPLEPGMMLKFDQINGTNVGVVMWTIDMGNKYRAGLKFV